MLKKFKFLYKTVAIAGTFDRLHKGHRFFISEAFESGEKVIVGLTSDRYAEGKLKNSRLSRIHDAVYAHTSQTASGQNSQPKADRPLAEKLKTNVNNYIERERELRDFLREEGVLGRTEIVSIDDVYGPAVEDGPIEALIVTSETMAGARKVNLKRKVKGLKSLKILKIPLVMAQDNRRIASTRIRLGEIDRWGKAFSRQISNFQFPISNNLREQLKKPLGIMIKGNPQNHKEVASELKKVIQNVSPSMLITVGDEVTKLGNEIGLPISLAIIDYRVRRLKVYNSLKDLGFSDNNNLKIQKGNLFRVRNPAGYVKRILVESVANALKLCYRDGMQRVIRVLGEEDLAGVPAILLAPLGSLVLYGQPEKGVVAVEVSEEKKEEISRLFRSAYGYKLP